MHIKIFSYRLFRRLFTCLSIKQIFSSPNKFPCLFYTTIILIFSSYSSFAEELIWPIDSPKSITSSFGEPRPGRFHYGIDFRSGGITGKKVFALGDGYISRIRTTPFGYGKVLYLTMDTGKTVVYAHLSGFLPEIEERLFKTRIKKRSYDIELWPKPYEYRISKGQVIAYSGDTGDGAPHLHMEIRDKNNHPLNPLEHGLNVRDTILPEINAIALIPLDNRSSVNGFPMTRWYNPDSLTAVMPVLSGKIGVAVSVWDRANNSRNHLGIYTISLSVDSLTVFSKHYTKLQYDFNGYGGFDYLPGHYYGGNGYNSALFRRTGNKVDFYEGNGVLPAVSDNLMNPHMLTITASDYAHNTADCSLRVVYGSRPSITNCGYTVNGDMCITGKHPSGRIDRAELWSSDDRGEWFRERVFPIGKSQCDIKESIPGEHEATYKAVLVAEDSTRSMPCIFRIDRSENADDGQSGIKIHPQLLHDRILVRISSSSPLASLPVVNIEVNGKLDEHFISTLQENDSTWVTAIPLPQKKHNIMRIKASAYDRFLHRVWDMSSLEFTIAGCDSPAAVYSPDSLFSITIRPGSLYRPSPVLVDTVRVIPGNELITVSKGYRVNHGDTPIKEASPVRLSLESEPPEGSALFVSGNGNGWGFLSDRREGPAFTGEIGSSGQIAVLADRHVPYIKPLAPKPGSTITNRRPLLQAYVEDKGAGIEGSDSISMSIDTIPVYGEYDYEAHTISYRLFNNLRSSAHKVTLTVTDRVGNTKTRTWSFTIK